METFTHINNITSMETLSSYLEKHSQLRYPIFEYIRHQISIAQTIKNDVSKQFLLREAEFYNDEIELSAKRFIAKRLYAFYAKKKFDLLEDRLLCFPNIAFQPSVEILLKILTFENISRSEFIFVEKKEIEHPIVLEKNTTTQEEKKTLPLVKRKSTRVPRTKTDVDYFSPIKNTRPEILQLKKHKEKQLQENFKLLQKFKFKSIKVKTITKDVVANICPKSISHLPKILQRFIKNCDNKEEKYKGMCLKYLISSNEKLLKKESNLLVIINYGSKKFDILCKISEVSSNKKFNQFVHQYFEDLLSKLMSCHRRDFKNAVASCYDRYDLFVILAQYPIPHKFYIEKFNLAIISNVKHVCEKTEIASNFYAIANEYLDDNDSNIKKALYTSLFESPVINKIWDAMQKAQTIYHFFQCLKQLKEIPETNKMATTIFQLVVTFLRGGKSISFHEFEISLNFAPNNLRNHTIRIITHKLQNDINYKLETFLLQKITIDRKWKKLLQLLNNKQFKGSKVKIFQYYPEELMQKLQKISNSEDDIKKVVTHEFREDNVPDELKNLIIAKHTQGSTKKENTIENFYSDFIALLEDGHKILSLRRPLGNLLQLYGKVNFGMKGSILTGYDLSNTISMFYRNAARTTILLPTNLNNNIATLIEDGINEERARQLGALSI